MKQAGIKIQLIEDPVTGEKRVPPVVMDLLVRFAEHKDLCEQCRSAYARGVLEYCATGHELARELGEQPEVSPMSPNA